MNPDDGTCRAAGPRIEAASRQRSDSNASSPRATTATMRPARRSPTSRRIALPARSSTTDSAAADGSSRPRVRGPRSPRPEGRLARAGPSSIHRSVVGAMGAARGGGASACAGRAALMAARRLSASVSTTGASTGRRGPLGRAEFGPRPRPDSPGRGGREPPERPRAPEDGRSPPARERDPAPACADLGSSRRDPGERHPSEARRGGRCPPARGAALRVPDDPSDRRSLPGPAGRRPSRAPPAERGRLDFEPSAERDRPGFASSAERGRPER